MVDWATQDRLFSSGYQPIDIRTARVGVDPSLPYSVALNKRHNCGLQPHPQLTGSLSVEEQHDGLKQAIDFHEDLRKTDKTKRGKLLATYAYNINWPRSVCYLSACDGSLVVCEQERCRLILYTSQLMLRSTCGGNRGDGQYELDSPWAVAEFVENGSSNVLVADSNNRRVQCFTIGHRGRFVYKYTLPTKEKPVHLATSPHWLAVTCEKGFLETFFIPAREGILHIDLNQLFSVRKRRSIAYCVCMSADDHSIFVSNPLATSSLIHQVSIDGKYVRTIKPVDYPFVRITSLTFDQRLRHFVIVDSINSLIYSLRLDASSDNVQILLKPSDHLNHPQGLCLTNEGHLVVVECSVLTQHAIKLFRYVACACHTRLATPSIKTSEVTSVRAGPSYV